MSVEEYMNEYEEKGERLWRQRPTNVEGEANEYGE